MVRTVAKSPVQTIISLFSEKSCIPGEEDFRGLRRRRMAKTISTIITLFQRFFTIRANRLFFFSGIVTIKHINIYK
jgi:hypothetical protein